MRRSAESDGFDTFPSRADFLNDLKTSRMEDKLDRFTGLTSVKFVIQEEESSGHDHAAWWIAKLRTTLPSVSERLRVDVDLWGQ